ncbi:helix-turn-helix domain-containing protein, partial [Haloferax profundi]|uniref:helix-turn-helix domain-containing protein n=1 Tax=Haloferax profundi TaxID=1544718 RepID=UPI000AB647F8
IDDVQRISSEGTSGVLRIRLSQPFIALELADHGALFQSASVTPSLTTIVVDVPESVELRRVTDLLQRTFGETELLSKHNIDQSTTQMAGPTFFEQLTERQLEVLQTAYYSGFFESPRENTGEDVASMLGISPAAFYQHVRTVQRKLFSALLDERGVQTVT